MSTFNVRLQYDTTNWFGDHNFVDGKISELLRLISHIFGRAWHAQNRHRLFLLPTKMCHTTTNCRGF